MALDQHASGGAPPLTRCHGRLSGLALLAAVVLGGCGSSNSLSSKQLQTQATRICSLASLRTNRIPTPASPAATAAFLERGATALTPALTGLRTLHPPSDVADVYTSTVGTLAQEIRYLSATARDIAHGVDPVKAMQELQQRLGPLESQENGGWQALQLPECMNR